jgi:mono/diheme cytochrome c family protein
MKKFLKFLKWTGIVLVGLFAVIFIFVQFTWDKKIDAPYPDITASTDSALIARGKYLAEAPAHCMACHVPMDKIQEVYSGKLSPLSGGWEETVPGFGTFRAPNLTPDEETGIGKLTDAELARSIRYMVRHDGKVMIPFMEYQGMSDEDLTAVISFLRSQPPVNNPVKPNEIGFMGKAVLAFGLLKAEGPKSTPPQRVEIDTTIVYGSYLANHVAACRGCHTEFDMNTGKQTGIDFAGKGYFPANELLEGYSFITPNLTPDPGTGVMAKWTEETFVIRFKAGRILKTTPMPWALMARMNDVELKAIYRYLQSLKPVENKIEKTVLNPGEKLPKQ